MSTSAAKAEAAAQATAPKHNDRQPPYLKGKRGTTSPFGDNVDDGRDDGALPLKTKPQPVKKTKKDLAATLYSPKKPHGEENNDEFFPARSTEWFRQLSREDSSNSLSSGSRRGLSLTTTEAGTEEPPVPNHSFLDTLLPPLDTDQSEDASAEDELVFHDAVEEDHVEKNYGDIDRKPDLSDEEGNENEEAESSSNSNSSSNDSGRSVEDSPSTHGSTGHGSTAHGSGRIPRAGRSQRSIISEDSSLFPHGNTGWSVDVEADDTGIAGMLRQWEVINPAGGHRQNDSGSSNTGAEDLVPPGILMNLTEERLAQFVQEYNALSQQA